MPDSDFAEVQDLATFIELVGQSSVGVIWSVTPAFSPDSIGSHRDVKFVVNGARIAQNALTQRLAALLVDALQIPEYSKDHLISGEGDLRVNDNRIEVLYEWDCAIPYQDPSETHHGKIELFTLDDHEPA